MNAQDRAANCKLAHEHLAVYDMLGDDFCPEEVIVKCTACREVSYGDSDMINCKDSGHTNLQKRVIVCVDSEL